MSNSQQGTKYDSLTHTNKAIVPFVCTGKGSLEDIVLAGVNKKELIPSSFERDV